LCGAIPARNRGEVIDEIAALNGACCGSFPRAVKSMGAGFQARILAHAVSLAGLGTYEGPEGVLLPITAEQLGQVTSGTADEATLDLYARSIAHGLVHVADATVARPREQEMMLASFAAGAARNYTSHESCVCPMFQARSLLVGG